MLRGILASDLAQKRIWNTSTTFDPLQKSGTLVKRVVRGTKSTLERMGLVRGRMALEFASSAPQSLRQKQLKRSCVPLFAEVDGAGECGKRRTQVRVYDLMVENHHEFIADGVLVHNCVAMAARCVRDRITPTPVGIDEDDDLEEVDEIDLLMEKQNKQGRIPSLFSDNW
jgi:hypothetical protein